MDVVSSRPVLPLAYTENEGVPMEVNRSFVQAEQPYVHLTDARFLSRERAIGSTPAAAVDIVEDEEIVVGITGEVAAQSSVTLTCGPASAFTGARWA